MSARWNSSDMAKKPQGVPQERRTPPASTTEPPQASRVAQGQEITFPGKVPGLNGAGGLLRMHWRAKYKLALSYEWRVKQCQCARFKGPVRLELVRYSTGRPMDYDNLVSTGKLLIDALVRNQVLPDDNPAVIAERVYTQERAASKEAQRTVIRLTDLSTPTP